MRGGQQELSAVKPPACSAGRDLAAAKHNDPVGHSNQLLRVVADQDG